MGSSQAEIYLSTVSEPERPKLSLREHRVPIALATGSVTAALLTWVIVGNTLAAWVLSGLALFLFARTVRTLDKATQAPVMGVNALEIVEIPRTSLPKPDTAEDVAMMVEEPPEVKVTTREAALYEKRFHILALIESLLRVAPVALVVWVLASLLPALAGASNREGVVQTLSAMAIVGGLVLTVSFFKLKIVGVRLSLRWLRWPASVAFVVAVVYLVALRWTEVLVTMTAGLFFLGAFLLLQKWARWHHTYIIVTNNRFSIELESPWFYLLGDSKPSVPVRKLTSVKAGKSRFEKMFNLNSGSIEADTPGQMDDDFHHMRRVVDHEELWETLSALIA